MVINLTNTWNEPWSHLRRSMWIIAAGFSVALIITTETAPESKAPVVAQEESGEQFNDVWLYNMKSVALNNAKLTLSVVSPAEASFDPEPVIEKQRRDKHAEEKHCKRRHGKRTKKCGD